MAEFGYFTLLLGLATSLYAAAVAVIGKKKGYPELIASSRNAVYAVAALVTISSLVLAYLFLTRDFQVAYVASYSSRDMSLVYTLVAFYGGQAGSMLLWALILGISCGIVVAQNKDRHRELMPYIIMVLMLVQAFFYLAMVTVTNPFEKLGFTPADGKGLNPLLLNPGMIIHPPAQLAGYAGFTIPFAFALAALITRRLNDEWLRSIRTWTLIFWVLLGIGNLAGAQWAYVELGWGGYWAWDPVENSGLMPWLTATAFLHSVMIQKRRGMLKIWNILLVILTFNLAIFGTMVTRSGIISSVHSFGDTSLGPFFLGFLAISVILSTYLLYWRSPNLKSDDEIDSLLSRESTFLINNLILVAATFATFLGTIFPMITEAVRGVKITVGPPFFDQVNGPIFLLLVLLMGICPLIGWRRASKSNLIRNFLYPFFASMALTVALFIAGIRAAFSLFGFAVCGFVLATIILELYRGARAKRRTSGHDYFSSFFGLIAGNRPRYGGYIVHVGIILMAIGVIGSRAYTTSVEQSLAPQETLTIQSPMTSKVYTLKYENLSQFRTESRDVVAATMSLYNEGQFVGQLTPEKAVYKNYDNPTTEVAIRSTLLEDVYIILIGVDQAGQVAGFKVVINPLVAWLWLGSLMLIGGTVVAMWPEKRRRQSS
ncbi:MAG: heme lyase CcmF/NrfE family subunit [Chloroflexi bacterium]|nr:heme lyase CcmF/NrfE family subunit [Chloroflexota bacterium]